ncbi:AI-2E family transporter [Mucilaginibacter antarcticus]|uniref:AI-2E family transporter n=2 Tax=Mucilaginibacter antarcticus TaxID=1855725 RepID=A0ABW5XN40_9SPHI
MTTKKMIAPFYDRMALIVIGIIALGYMIVLGKEILDPLMFGFLFAILLLPISNFLERKFKFPRSMSSFVAILLFLAFISFIFYLVGAQISRLMDDWPMLQKQISQSLNNIYDWVEGTFKCNVDKQKEFIHRTEVKILSSGTAVVNTTFGAVSSLALFYVFIIIFTFFILFYRRVLYTFIQRTCSTEHEPIVHDISGNVQGILRQYILGLVFEMVIVAAVACTAFWMIGIKYAVLLGIMVGLFNIIPYLGIFTALLLSVLITFATGPISHAIEVGIAVIAIHALDVNVLLPTVVGSKLRLNALITFLGIVLGEMMWGLSGMFLSIPVIAIFKIIFDRIESTKPWGYLLGGDYEIKKTAAIKMKTE